MLKIKEFKDLPSLRGRVGINFDGTVIIQQGRPHGVMANPGEVFLNQDDLDLIKDMLDDFVSEGGEILDPDVIRPCSLDVSEIQGLDNL